MSSTHKTHSVPVLIALADSYADKWARAGNSDWATARKALVAALEEQADLIALLDSQAERAVTALEKQGSAQDYGA
jgi:hypothetical protein